MTTPMMQQYREAKSRHPGMLLLFRMGDFYELFFDDAEVASRVLGLTLTSRDGTIPMAGFPWRALGTHLPPPPRRGHPVTRRRPVRRGGPRVAAADRAGAPARARVLARREVGRVATPGTLTEDDLLD